MIGEHVENGNTEQTQNNTPNAKLEDIMIEGTSQEVSQKSERWEGGPDDEFWFWSPYDFEYAEQSTEKSFLLFLRRRCAVGL
jgi:hypothetical protein